MTRLWLRMAEIFGHKWVSQYGPDPLETWAIRLGQLSAQQIAIGVSKCASSALEWPPSLPDFCGMCIPDAASFGLPDATTAFMEAMRHSHEPRDFIFSHEAVRIAGDAVGWYDMHRCMPSEESLRKRFDAAYGALVGKIQRGEPLSKPLQAIESDSEASPMALAEKEAERKIYDRIREQGLEDKTPAQLRAEMLAKMGIKR
jgi:Replication protein P